jgi:molybdopterin converting factor subunit 1
MVRVLYFAWLRERAGRAEEQLTLPPGVATVGALAAWLQARDAAGAAVFSDLAVIRAAVNQGFAAPGATIADGDEVAFFPPVTGG